MTKQHGGRREGAGRKSKYSEPMKRIDVRLPPSWLAQLKEEFGSYQAAIETLVKTHLGHQE